MDKLEYSDTEPLRAFARKRGISPTKVYEWIDSGELETFLEGHRRHIVVSSYDRLVRKRVAEQGSLKLPSSNPKIKARQSASVEAGSQDASEQRLDSPIVPGRRNRGGQRAREMTGIGRAAQDELAPSVAAAAPREQSAKLQMCSSRAAVRETGGGSDGAKALAADLGRDAHSGGRNGGRATCAQSEGNKADLARRHSKLVD
jgi:hypothetical protein